MASPTDIANMALIELGADVIADIGQSTGHAKFCAARYSDVRDEVLRAHPWECARRRFSLPARAERPEYGFLWAYTLPTDPPCLRVIRLEHTDLRWTVEGRLILTDAPAPLRGLYVAQVDEADWDASLTRAVALRLATAIAYRVTQSAAMRDSMDKAYREALREARSANAQETGWEIDPTSDLLASRI